MSSGVKIVVGILGTILVASALYSSIKEADMVEQKVQDEFPVLIVRDEDEVVTGVGFSNDYTNQGSTFVGVVRVWSDGKPRGLTLNPFAYFGRLVSQDKQYYACFPELDTPLVLYEVPHTSDGFLYDRIEYMSSPRAVRTTVYDYEEVREQQEKVRTHLTDLYNRTDSLGSVLVLRTNDCSDTSADNLVFEYPIVDKLERYGHY